MEENEGYSRRENKRTFEDICDGGGSDVKRFTRSRGRMRWLPVSTGPAAEDDDDLLADKVPYIMGGLPCARRGHTANAIGGEINPKKPQTPLHLHQQLMSIDNYIFGW